MSTVGLQVINDGGIVQIDQFYRNLVFIQKTSSASTGIWTWTTQTGRTAPVPVLYSTSAPTIPTAGITIVGSTKNGDGSFTYTFMGAGEVYLFDVPNTPPANGFGLQVFGSDGKIIFDSNTKPMIVRDARIFSGPVQASVGGDYYSIPTQTLSVAPETYGTTIVEWTTYGTFAAYQKPSAQKWGWICQPYLSCITFINTPAAGGPSSSPYGAGDGNIHKGLGAVRASGNNFIVSFRDFIVTSSYWNGQQNWSSRFIFVDITNL
jgi:hypothetical protein